MQTTTHGNMPPKTGTSNGADGAVNKASSSAHAAVDSFAGAADEAVRKAKPAIDKVTAQAHQAVDKAADAAGPAADWLSEKSASLEAQTCAYVKANPLKAIGIAVVAGIVLSRIL